MTSRSRGTNEEQEDWMGQERKSRRWRDGAGSVAALCLTVLTAGCDLLEREPYPVMRSEFQVEEGSSDGSRTRFRWLDSA